MIVMFVLIAIIHVRHVVLEQSMIERLEQPDILQEATTAKLYANHLAAQMEHIIQARDAPLAMDHVQHVLEVSQLTV